MNEAKTILELSATDLQLMKIKKHLEELPQREQLLKLRTQRAEIDVKRQQVEQMRKDCDRALSKLQDEEVMVREKSAEVQKQVDASSDHKEVAALVKEIESLAKRLERLEFDELKLMERFDKITLVEVQVDGASERLAKQDESLLAAYQAEVGSLKKAEHQAEDTREQLIAKLPSELARRYEKARAARAGFGAAHIEGTHCSGCRVEFTEGQIAKLKSEEHKAKNIAECPYCHRLLVVEI